MLLGGAVFSMRQVECKRPFLVGGVIWLVNSGGERDLNLLNSCM